MIQHPYGDIETFGLGELPPREADALFDHADHCPTCAVLVAEAMHGVAALDSAASRSEVPQPGLRSMRVRKIGSRPWAAVAAVASAASLALFAWNLDLRAAQPQLPPTPVAALVHSHFTHHPLTGAPGAGSAKAIVAADGSWVFVVADQLAAELPYDVWESRAGGRVKLGTFTTDTSGEGTAYFKVLAAKPQGFQLVASGQDPESDLSALHWP